MYISEKVRNHTRMQYFRAALSGQKTRQEPDPTIKDFGITDPVKKDDLHAVGSLMDKATLDHHAEEEHLVTGQPIPADDLVQKKPSIVVRMLSGSRSERASRAETVISRSSTSVSYETPEHPHKEIQVSKSFHDKAMDTANNADPSVRDVNAVQMLMENIFDWDFHERHQGDTVTPKLLSDLMKSLKMNIHAACPSIHNHKSLELFAELGDEGWLGDIVNVKHMTARIVEAYLEAQNGNSEVLNKVERFLQAALKFNQRFYAPQREARVPLRTLAAILEKQGGRPAAVRPGLV